MFHYLYKITNNINGKEYVGIHSTLNIDDKYFGSGTYFKRAVKKEGRENFEKIIIGYFDSRKELEQAEKDYVNIDYIKNENVYNLVLGGCCGFITVREKKSEIKIKEIIYVKDIPENDIIEMKCNQELINNSLWNDDNSLHKLSDLLLSITPLTCESINRLYNDKRFHDKMKKFLVKMLYKGDMNRYIYFTIKNKDSSFIEALKNYGTTK